MGRIDCGLRRNDERLGAINRAPTALGAVALVKSGTRLYNPRLTGSLTSAANHWRTR